MSVVSGSSEGAGVSVVSGSSEGAGVSVVSGSPEGAGVSVVSGLYPAYRAMRLSSLAAIRNAE